MKFTHGQPNDMVKIITLEIIEAEYINLILRKKNKPY